MAVGITTQLPDLDLGLFWRPVLCPSLTGRMKDVSWEKREESRLLRLQKGKSSSYLASIYAIQSPQPFTGGPCFLACTTSQVFHLALKLPFLRLKHQSMGLLKPEYWWPILGNSFAFCLYNVFLMRHSKFPNPISLKWHLGIFLEDS